MKILILGSEGFIGRHCVSFFLQKGWEVYGCDLLDYASDNYHYTKISRLSPTFDEVFANIKYNACINAAGNGSVPVSIEHPVNDFEANCSDVIRILELIKLKTPRCKYIHISSAAVYGNPQKLPVTEEDWIKPLSPYGWHKHIAEVLCREYHVLYQAPVVIVRPFSIYGPGLHKQLFWDLHQKCKHSPEELVLWGTGDESRDFIYISDLVEALYVILLNSPMEADIYNLASGVDITIADAAQQFIDCFSSPVKLKFNQQERAGDPKNWRAGITKVSGLGYNGKYTFANGIKETAQWLKNLQ
jgi:dTDP-glucose 4,6-dehydratase/UDP-glucose 4-epimerase